MVAAREDDRLEPMRTPVPFRVVSGYNRRMMPTDSLRRRSRLGAVVMLLAASLALPGGCYRPGDMGWEGAPATWTSTTTFPARVTLIDTRTGEEVWSSDVPPDMWLVTRFRPDAGNDDPDARRPDRLAYGLFPAGTTGGMLRSSLPVPGPEARRWVLERQPARREVVPPLADGPPPSDAEAVGRTMAQEETSIPPEADRAEETAGAAGPDAEALGDLLAPAGPDEPEPAEIVPAVPPAGPMVTEREDATQVEPLADESVPAVIEPEGGEAEGDGESDGDGDGDGDGESTLVIEG